MEIVRGIERGRFRTSFVFIRNCDLTENVLLFIEGVEGGRHLVRKYTMEELLKVHESMPSCVYPDAISAHLMWHAEMAWPTN